MGMTEREKVIKDFADYEPYARNFPAITIKSGLYLEALALLNEQKAKIRSLEQTIEDICCGGQ